MCGLAGWLHAGAPDAAVIVQRMTERLAHRGPDASGIYASGSIALGHRRLSILDTASRANQPMLSADNRLAIVFNGEIYNFRELRSELERRGEVFATTSDTEVILSAYRQWGVECLQRFNGMFAFALWNDEDRSLFLARDRSGEKPLFYARTHDGGLVFASEPAALRLHPAVETAPDPAALARFLTANYIAGEQTLFAGIKRLPPASYLLAKGGTARIRPYWSLLPSFQHKADLSEADAAEALAALIDDSTRLRLISDVPLGAFLSAGMDSATVVSSMTRAAHSVHAFTIGFGDASYDEIDGAEQTAAALGVHHSHRRVGLDAPAMIEAIRHAAAEPLADNSAIPTWFLCRFAREHVTVALSGDGGDELFAGYETYVADRFARRLMALPRPIWPAALSVAERVLPQSSRRIGLDFKIRQFLRGVHLGWPRAHGAWRMIFAPDELEQLVQPEWRDAVARSDPLAALDGLWQSAHACAPLDQALFVDTTTWMVDDVLTKVDRMSMAHGLEVRTPFLDHRVMEFAASLPAPYKLKGFRKKHILRASQAGRIPCSVFRRGKMGFNAPMSDWLRGPLREFAGTVLRHPGLRQWLRPEAVERLWQEHMDRQRDHGFKLFGLLIFSLWLETYA